MTSPPLRVTFVQPYLPAYRAPVYRRLAAVPGIDLTIVHASTPWLPNVPADGFRAVFEPMSIRHVAGHPVYWQPSYQRHSRRDACDVLVCMWDVHYAPNVVPAILAARRHGIGTVLWGQGYSRKENWLRRRPRAWVGRMADALVFYNRTGRELFLTEGFDPERMFVAYNSIDAVPIDEAIARWRADPPGLAAFKQEHGLGGRPLVLLVARLFPDRKTERLVEAVAILAQRGVDCDVALVGGGEADYLDLLKRLAADRGVADRFRFVGPCYDEVRLAPWFLSARVFCFPSFMGLSLHHAFAYGLPVVTTDRLNANHPEIEALTPGVNGLVYRDGDVNDLAEQLGRLLTDDALVARLSADTRRTLDETYNLDRMVEGFVGAIQCAYERRHPAPSVPSPGTPGEG